MQKIFKLTIYILILSTLLLVLCESTQTKDDDAEISDEQMAWVTDNNAKLVKQPVLGFKYKNARLNRYKWNVWVRKTAPLVKKLLKELPNGYVLQITGHADASGPEQPEGRKPGNLKISTERAKAVYNAMKRAGISSPRLTYKGVGSSRLIYGVDPKSSKQRRVTFEIIPGEYEETKKEVEIIKIEKKEKVEDETEEDEEE